MTTTMNIIIDSEIKTRAERVARGVGVRLNKLVGDYVKNIAHHSVDLPRRPVNKRTEKILDAVEKDLETGKNITGPFKNAKAAIRYLNSL